MSEPSRPTSVRLTLTPEQRARIRQVLARDADTIELQVEELEERIAPKLAANHNEAVLDGRVPTWSAASSPQVCRAAAEPKRPRLGGASGRSAARWER
jgi:hypothetical protein